MTEYKVAERFEMVTLDHRMHLNDFAEDVRIGLNSSPKKIPPIYFYDKKGSILFEKICDLPEYYPTRSETEILKSRMEEICHLFEGEISLVELGSGSAKKTRILIDYLVQKYGQLVYHPIDISSEILRESSETLLEDFPGLDISAVSADYIQGLDHLNVNEYRPMLVLWLGSSIGNFERQEAVNFLKHVVKKLKPQDHLLIGIDLRKEKHILEAAYDDAQGITAQFNKNLLDRMNRELDAEFDKTRFKHKAIYNEKHGRIEMHLVSMRQQEVTIDSIPMKLRFSEGETIHTENSYKYSLQEIDDLCKNTGLVCIDQWFDSQKEFSLNLFKPQ